MANPNRSVYINDYKFYNLHVGDGIDLTRSQNSVRPGIPIGHTEVIRGQVTTKAVIKLSRLYHMSDI